MAEYVSDKIKYVGVDDQSIDIFEGQYQVPNGISYNSYIIFQPLIQTYTKQYIITAVLDWSPVSKCNVLHFV